MKSTLSKLQFNNSPILLPVILLLGLLLRLYDLGGESLWLDEAVSVEYAKLNLSRIFFLLEQTPPLYNIILHWWIHIFGTSEFSIRFPSVTFGCLSVFMMYRIGSRLFDKNAGTLSSLLLAFSVFHIQYSQEARTYSLSVLLTLLSMYSFIKLLEEVSYKSLTEYVLSSILLIYSHIYGSFIIIAQNIYFITLPVLSKETRKLDVRKWFSIQFLLILLFAPWVPVFVHQATAVQKGFWIETPQISAIISTFKTYSSGSTSLLLLFLVLLLFSLLSHEKPRAGMGLPVVPESLKRRWEMRALNSDKICFLLIWLIIPIIFPFIISRLSQPIYYDRYTIVASSAFYLLVARGISNVSSRRVKSIAISAVIILSLISVSGYYAEIKKEQWREVAEYIDTNAHDGDAVLFNAFYCVQPFNYYSHSDLLVKKGFPEKDRKVNEENINKLLETIVHHDRIWVVLAHSGDKNDLITKTLIKSYNLSHHSEYKDIKLYLFDKDYRHTASRLPASQP